MGPGDSGKLAATPCLLPLLGGREFAEHRMVCYRGAEKYPSAQTSFRLSIAEGWSAGSGVFTPSQRGKSRSRPTGAAAGFYRSPMTTRRKRTCGGKRRYLSKACAFVCASGALHSEDGGSLRAYFCPLCSGWHLTKKPLRWSRTKQNGHGEPLAFGGGGSPTRFRCG